VLTGREIVRCIVLTPEEIALARSSSLDGIAVAAARVASKLPRRDEA
jgi:hypothetical protein